MFIRFPRPCEMRAGEPSPYEDRKGEVVSIFEVRVGGTKPTRVIIAVGAGFPRPLGWGTQPLRGIRTGGPHENYRVRYPRS